VFVNGLCVIMAGLVAAMQAPADPVLSLDDAIAQALKNNRNVQIAALEVDKADNELRALQTRRLPNFDLKTISGALSAPLDLTFKTGVFGTYPQIGPVPGADTVIRTDPRWATVFSARVAQPLTQLRTVGHGERALQVGRDLAREAVREQELNVAASVKQLYYGIAQAQSGLRANGEAVTLYRDVVRLMNDYLAHEAVLPGDALSARVALAKQEHTGTVLENTLSTLKEQLNALLGRDPGTAFSAAPAEAPASVEFDVAAAETRALAQRPEVREARLKAEQARMAVILKRDELVPEVNVAFTYLGFYNFEVLPRNIALFGVTGSWEPWDWGRRRAETAVKAKTLDQATLGVAEAENLIKVDVRSHARKVQEARALLTVSDLGRQAAREKLRVAAERFRQEASLQREVLEAEAGAAEADLQYQQALAGFWTARAEFDKALGER
jgi:outer membrane protein TolC